MTKKQFDAVKYMRQQREDLSKKLAHMSRAEIVAYFQSKEAFSKVKTHTPPQKFH